MCLALQVSAQQNTVFRAGSFAFSRLFQTEGPVHSETAPALSAAIEPSIVDEVNIFTFDEKKTTHMPQDLKLTLGNMHVQEDEFDVDLTPKQVVDRLDRYIVGQVCQSA